MALHTVRAAAGQLGVAYSTLKRWVHTGHVRTIRTEGGHHRISDAEIDHFCALIREVASEATVLLIEHNMAVVMELAQRITVMNIGRILAEGTPDEIRANPQVQEAYLGS